MAKQNGTAAKAVEPKTENTSCKNAAEVGKAITDFLKVAGEKTHITLEAYSTGDGKYQVVTTIHGSK